MNPEKPNPSGDAQRSSISPLSRNGSRLPVSSYPPGISHDASPLQCAYTWEDSEGEPDAPPKLSDLGQSTLEQRTNSTPKLRTKSLNLRIIRDRSTPGVISEHDTPVRGISLRIRRIGLQGAPVRRGKGPQTDDEKIGSLRHHTSPSSDVGSFVASIPQSHVEPSPNPHQNSPANSEQPVTTTDDPRPIPPSNTLHTPRRPTPPPPPRLLTLEQAARPPTAKQRRTPQFTVNGETYTQIGGRFGKGGSSDVYQVRARDSRLYALKRVKLSDVDESTIKGYMGEIELLNELRDEPRVVRLHDSEFNQQKERLTMVMELGEADLSSVIRMEMNAKEHSKLNIPFTRFYWREMLVCVAAVHARDIVHSDLKPANFLLVSGVLKLIDFGIANAIDTDRTVNIYRDNLVGTVNFMSPESLQDGNAKQTNQDRMSRANPKASLGKVMKLGKPSDIWSLGGILYQMVYGQAPFAHLSTMAHRVLAIIDHTVTIEFPTDGIGGVEVPLELRRTMRACLNRDPLARPTAEELLSENNLWLHPENSNDLYISEGLLARMVETVAGRFKDERGPPTKAEVDTFAASFYSKIKEWTERE